MIPVEFIFNPNWWFRNYGISFDRPFYFDPRARIDNDVRMRRALHERFGLGERDPQPRPIAGSRHVAGGFAIPALLGVEIRFADSQAPWNLPANLDRAQILALRVPELETTWPMSEWIAQMDALEKEFGYVVGDFNTGGVINTALELRGQQLFLDMLEDTELTAHVFRVAAETAARVAAYVKGRTGTCSVAVNRSIVNVDAGTFLDSNCSIQMISPRLYQATLLEWEQWLARKFQPFGIHHCGNNLHRYAELYAATGASFYDVGWGSDVVKCSELLPDAFLNLRLSPVRMLQCPAGEIRRDVESLLRAAGRTAKVGLCAINLDYGTPDENVLAVLDAAKMRQPGMVHLFPE
jgi:hypothetical protein